jgi:hypothetical protein
LKNIFSKKGVPKKCAQLLVIPDAFLCRVEL